MVGLLQPREGHASIRTLILLAAWSRARPIYQRGHYRATRPIPPFRRLFGAHFKSNRNAQTSVNAFVA